MEFPGAAEWRAHDWPGALRAIAGAMLAAPDRADLLEGLLGLTRSRFRATRAGNPPQLVILRRASGPTASGQDPSAGRAPLGLPQPAALRAARAQISHPTSADPWSVLAHPCDRLVIEAGHPEAELAAELWGLFWGAEIHRDDAPILRVPADRLWPDAEAEAAFRAAGGWHRLVGLPVPAAPALRAQPRAPRGLIWARHTPDAPLPQPPQSVPAATRHILFAQSPLSAPPAPWELRLLPPGTGSDPEQVSVACPALFPVPAHLLPPHDLGLFLAPDGALLPDDPAARSAQPVPVQPLPARRGFARQIRASSPAPQVDVTLLTPTGDRLAAFARCAWLVQSQTLRPREWLIVDDGALPVEAVIPLPDYARVLRRPRRPDDPPHTLSANLGAALPEIRTDKVVIIEDDDWYAPDYLETLLPALEGAGMAGLNHIHYYHLRAHAWKTGTPPAHTALAQTAFRMQDAGAVLARLCADPPEEVRRFGVIDRHWWHAFDGPKRLLRDHAQLHLGLKGGFGRAGLASGHDAAEPDYIPDPGGARLIEMLGEDIRFYDRLRRPPASPDAVVVYSAVAAGEPPPAPPPYSWTIHDPVLLSHDPELSAPGWRVLPLDERFADPARDPRKAAILPHLYFPDRALSLWVDPKSTLPAEPEALLAGFRDQASLAISAPLWAGDEAPGLLLRRHNEPGVMQAMLGWWQAGGAGCALPEAVARAGLAPIKTSSPGV